MSQIRPTTKRVPRNADGSFVDEAYEAAYGDELASCEAGLDKYHPRWRDKKRFDNLPPQQFAQVKRLLKRRHQIVAGHGDWGVVIAWKIGATGARVKPYAHSRKPRYHPELLTQIFDENFVQILSPPVFAQRTGCTLDEAVEAIPLYNAAIAEGKVIERRPREWVDAYLAKRRRRAKRRGKKKDESAL